MNADRAARLLAHLHGPTRWRPALPTARWWLEDRYVPTRHRARRTTR